MGLCFVLALMAVGPLVHAQSVSELQAKIEESNREIERIQKEIEELRNKLVTTAEEKQTLQNAINKLNLSIQKIQKDISLTQVQIDKKDLEIGELSYSIDDTQSKIARSQIGIGSTLRELHELDNEPVVLHLLSGATLSAIFNEAAALSTLRSELEGKIQELSSLKENLEEDKTSAESKRQELATLSEELGVERQGLSVARTSQSELLVETKNKEAEYQAQIAAKEAEQKAFESALFELASQLQYILDPSSIPEAGNTVLRWPLDSVFITQQFGKTQDSVRLYTSGTHDGIDLRASVGTPVKAALTGTVEEINQGAVPYCQYGKWVLVRHNNGLSTLYAHLSEITVKKGDAVATGKVVGYAGNTGYATGPHLHFTVYVSEAVSLKQYTCRSGGVVTIPIAPTNAYLDPLSYLPT